MYNFLRSVGLTEAYNLNRSNQDELPAEAIMAEFLVIATIVLCFVLGILTSQPGCPVR